MEAGQGHGSATELYPRMLSPLQLRQALFSITSQESLSGGKTAFRSFHVILYTQGWMLNHHSKGHGCRAAMDRQPQSKGMVAQQA